MFFLKSAYISAFLDPHAHNFFYQKIFLGHIFTFLRALEPNALDMAQKNVKNF